MQPRNQTTQTVFLGIGVAFVLAFSQPMQAGVTPITTSARAGAFAHVDPNPPSSWDIHTDFQSSGDATASAYRLDSANSNALSCEATTSTTGHTDPGGAFGNATLHAHWVAVDTIPPGNQPSGTYSAEMKFFYSFFTDAPMTISITVNSSLVVSGDTNAADAAMTVNRVLTVNGQFTDIPPNGTTNVQYALNAGFHQLLLEHYPSLGMSPWPNVNATAETQMTFTIKQQGDMNCDGKVNGLDIQAFVQALLNPAGYSAAYPGCDINNGDMNHDAAVSTTDAPLFAHAVLGN